MNSEEQLNKVVREWKSLLGRTDILILDTETTGKYAEEIVELGIINTRGENVFESYILPRKEYVHMNACRAPGLTREALKAGGAPHLSEVWEDVWMQLAAAEHLLIYYSKFDLKALRKSLCANNIEITDEVKGLREKTYCIMREYAYLRQTRHSYYKNWKWRTLVSAAKDEKVPVKDAHKAIGDCRMTLGVIRNTVTRMLT